MVIIKSLRSYVKTTKNTYETAKYDFPLIVYYVKTGKQKSSLAQEWVINKKSTIFTQSG